MKIGSHTRAIALTAIVGALTAPALAVASSAPDALERYAAAHPYVKQAPPAPRSVRIITDTLGGNGRPAATPAYTFITDTLGGNGHPAAAPGFTFITDTLGGNGGPGVITAAHTGFDWGDAGLGAGAAFGGLTLLFGSVRLRRQLRHRPQTA